jgi:DNA-binding MarR family transcriptional regulator
MHLQITQALHRGLVADVGLSYQDFIILAELAEGPRRVTDLATSLGLEKGRLSHQLKRLSERGLVVKTAVAEDRRGARAELAVAGRRLLQQAMPRHRARVRRLFGDHLTGAEVRALTSVVRKVGAALPAKDGA